MTVAFTVVKGDRPEWTVQKLTELGVDVIVPMHTERSVVRWTGSGGRAPRGSPPLSGAAGAQAVMQSRRSRLPVIEPVAPFAEVVARPRHDWQRQEGARRRSVMRSSSAGPGRLDRG